MVRLKEIDRIYMRNEEEYLLVANILQSINPKWKWNHGVSYTEFNPYIDTIGRQEGVSLIYREGRGYSVNEEYTTSHGYPVEKIWEFSRKKILTDNLSKILEK